MDSCDDVGGCEIDDAPRTGCLAAPKSILLMKQNGGAKDKLVWKWIKGAAVTPANLGNPQTSADYAFCLYAGGVLVAGADLAAGSAWTATATGYKYSDPSGSSDGIIKALLKQGIAGKSKVLVKGKGNNLPDPALGSLALPVTAQLVNTTSGFCVGASFAGPNVITSGASVFKAKAP